MQYTSSTDHDVSELAQDLNELAKISVKPHIIPTYADPYIDGQDGDATSFAALSNHPTVQGVKLNAKGNCCY